MQPNDRLKDLTGKNTEIPAICTALIQFMLSCCPSWQIRLKRLVQISFLMLEYLVFNAALPTGCLTETAVLRCHRRSDVKAMTQMQSDWHCQR